MDVILSNVTWAMGCSVGDVSGGETAYLQKSLSLFFFFSVLSGWSHVAGLAEKLDQQWRPQSANMYISQSGPGLCVHVCSILETVIATLDHNGKKERERVRERERELVL